MSPIDKIFEQIFGYLPNKPGTAYEMLSCIAEHLMTDGDISHDARVRGEFSRTLYQIDVHSTCSHGEFMGEAKDYTLQSKKVGRGDLQKLGGALPDLPMIERGRFYSATGYTSSAKKYADSASMFPGNKAIEIFELRPSTEIDEEGLVKTICIHMHLLIPRPSEGKWVTHFTQESKEKLKELIPDGQTQLTYDLRLEEFYDSNGVEKTSLFELTRLGYGEINSEDDVAHGSYYLPGNFIYVNGLLVEMLGLEYEVPYSKVYQKMEICDDSEHRFILKNAAGDIVRFITDKEIKGYCFNENGRLIAPP